MEMRDRLIELMEQGVHKTPCEYDEDCDCTGIKCDACVRDSIADHLLANGVIVPPVRVGGKVYKISRNKVKECEVVFVGISADAKCSHFNFVENYADGTFYKSYSMVFDVIGKTVFLTKEEAEAKLKEREGNG